MFVDTPDLVLLVGFSQSSISVCVFLWTESIPHLKTSQHIWTHPDIRYSQTVISLLSDTFGNPFGSPLEVFVSSSTEKSSETGTFVHVCGHNRLGPTSRVQSVEYFSVCVFVNRVNTLLQDFSVHLDPSRHSLLSNSDLSVELHLWQPIRFTSRGFRKLIYRKIKWDGHCCACLWTQPTWSY